MLYLRVFTLSISLFFACCVHAQSTTMNYKIGAAFFDLGSYTITQKIVGDSTYYDAVSEVVVPYLFSKYQVRFETHTEFLRDTMRLCNVDVMVNDKLRESNHTEFTGNNYKIYRVDEDGKVRDEYLNVPAIFVTSSMLFFNEPDEQIIYTQNYAELYGYFNKLEALDNNSHVITDKETGRKTKYNYKKGRVNSTEVDYPIMTFGLTRIKD